MRHQVMVCPASPGFSLFLERLHDVTELLDHEGPPGGFGNSRVRGLIGQQDVTVAVFTALLDKSNQLAAGHSLVASMVGRRHAAEHMGWLDGSLSEESAKGDENSVCQPRLNQFCA